MTLNGVFGQRSSGLFVPAQEVNDFHNNDDVDSSQASHHHTLGKSPNQAAPGNHVHTDLSKPWVDLPLTGNAWVAFDAARTPQYARNALGEAIFRGIMKNGIALGVFANVPVGFRPEPRAIYEHYFPVVANNAFGAISVGSNGDLYFQVGSNVFVDLSTIRYKAVI